MPYLVQTRGPSLGKTFTLGERCVLGRNPDCDVVVPHDSVSRQHARIVLLGRYYFVEDLESRNGTILNDLVVHGRCRLSDGDVLRLSHVEFSYREAAPPRSLPPEATDSDTRVYLDDGQTVSVSPVQLTMDVEPRLDASRLAAAAQAKLHALLDITLSLGGRFFSLDKLLPKILDCLFTMIPQVERGCIVLRDEAGRLAPMWTKSTSNQASEQRVNRAIVEEAMAHKRAIVSSDIEAEPPRRPEKGLATLQVRSVMCAPLVDDNGDAFGVVQVETSDFDRAFQQEELELLVGVATQAAMAITINRLHLSELKRRTLERDLELAAKVQRDLLPRQAPHVSGYDFADYYQPAEAVGGDYYDYVTTPGGRVAVIIADVVGHGIAAALSMSKLSAEVRLSVATFESPSQILTALNANMWRQSLDGRFITLLIAVLDPARHEVTLACAGHMPPLLRSASGTLSEPGRDGYGPPLGAMVDFPYSQHTFGLAPGESLALYTDGITEATNATGQAYGDERLRDQVAAAAAPAEIVQRVIGDLARFTELRAHRDDICLTCLGRKPIRPS